MIGPTGAKALAGFREVTADVKGAGVEHDALPTGGVLVKHAGTRVVGEKGSRRHTFITRGGEGMPFEVWGTSDLDDKVRKLRAGAIVFLSYNGRAPHPDFAGKEMHSWTVADSGRTQMNDQLRAVEAEFSVQTEALEKEIAAAREKESERIANGPRNVSAEADLPDWVTERERAARG